MCPMSRVTIARSLCVFGSGLSILSAPGCTFNFKLDYNLALYLALKYFPQGRKKAFYPHFVTKSCTAGKMNVSLLRVMLQEAFALFDRDRDGEINTEELAKVGMDPSKNMIFSVLNQSPFFLHS